MNRMEWIGRHEGLLRDVSRGCSYGDPMSLKQGAKLLSSFIPDDCTIVPMPSHIGYATTMLSLCEWIASEINSYTKRNGVVIWNGLICDPHESSHIVKLCNGVPPIIKMYAKSELPEGKVIVIDNTICTGMTASAALNVLPNAIILTITKG